MPAAQTPPPVGDVAARVAGFMAQLRHHGFTVGPGDTQLVLSVLAAHDLTDLATARLGLKTMLSGDRARWERFDGLFDGYWLGRGLRVVERAPGQGGTQAPRRPNIWDRVLPRDEDAGGAGGRIAQAGLEGDRPHERSGTGRLVASRDDVLSRADLRTVVTPEEIADAERIAEHLARAIRDRLSRRRVADLRGVTIDLRRTIRRNLPRGGEPVDLLRRRRRERPVNLVVLLDVSGSMKGYSGYFLSFVRGLLCVWLRADAFLFHTRLVRITDAFRERDPLRAMARLSLLAEGFGGGTRIAASLKTFNDCYAPSALKSRSVVVMVSDGYDTDPPGALVAELRRLKRRARRLVWLNPLLGWKEYAPVAGAMAAALPYIDCFAAAHSLASLAALEGEFARL